MIPQDSKIETIDLKAYFGKFQALKGINMQIPNKKVTAIIGPSGCGKSTYIRCINRMHEIIPAATFEGEILLNGTSILKSDPRKIRKMIGMVFQKPNPFPSMTIRENVLAGIKLQSKRIKKSEQNDLVEWSLTKSALWDEVKDKLNHPGTSLSGGQQQRLCIARALTAKPNVLLMDEPCSALDPIATSYIENLIAELAKDYTVAIVTHSMQQAARISDYTAFFYMGELIEFNETDTIFTRPEQKRTEDYITGRFG